MQYVILEAVYEFMLNEISLESSSDGPIQAQVLLVRWCQQTGSTCWQDALPPFQHLLKMKNETTTYKHLNSLHDFLNF